MRIANQKWFLKVCIYESQVLVLITQILFMKKIIFTQIFAIAIIFTQILEAQTYLVDTFNMLNTPALTTNALSAIAIGKQDVIWVGSTNQGVYRFKYFDDESFVKAPFYTDHAIKHMVTDWAGRVYIGQHGKTGAQAINGGVGIIQDSSFNFKHRDGLAANPKSLRTRYVRSICIDKDYSNKLYVSNSDDLTAGNPRLGGMSIIRKVSDSNNYSVTKIAANTMYNIDAVQMSAIEYVKRSDYSEVWLAANRNCAPCTAPRIVRLDTAGYTIGYYDGSNSILPLTNIASSPTVRAIKQDDQKNVWVGLTTGEIYMYNMFADTWIQANTSSFFPSGTLINFNAITCHNGKVYIGTQNGLLIFNGVDVSNPSSFRLLGLNEGLANENITGIAIDIYGSIWCTSSGGLMRIREENKYLTAYKVPYNDLNGYEIEFDISKLSIAADSSRTIRFNAWGIGLGTGTKVLRILEDTTNLHPEKYGQLEFLDNNGTSTLNYSYRSPIYFDSTIGNKQSFVIHLQLYDTVSKVAHEEKEIKIIRTPVLFLHGLNSNSLIWNKLENELQFRGYYNKAQLMSINYPNKDKMATNKKVIQEQVIRFQKYLSYDNIACGKVDIVGHSMGGIMGRLYLQSPAYKNDVNKLITVNTPHSGSPWGNLVTNIKNGIFTPQMGALFGMTGLNLLHDISINEYATNDLAIGSTALTQMLNTPSGLLNSQRAKVHAVYTTKFDPITIPVNPSLLINWKRITLRWSTIKRSFAPVSFLFNGAPNDLIVGDSSQKGGLNILNSSFIPDQQHSGSTENVDVINTLTSLLTSSPLSSEFTNDGFSPYNLVSPLKVNLADSIFVLNSKQKYRTNSTLDITSPTSGTGLYSGSNVSVNVTGSNDIEDIIIFYGSTPNPNNGMYQLGSNSSSFNITIPEVVDGKFWIIATGYSDSGLVAMDTLSIQISQESSILEAIYAPTTTVVEINDSTDLLLYGRFSDGITRMIGYNNLTISTDPLKCQHAGLSRIHGVGLGQDSVEINYGGFSTKALVEIIPSSNIPLPEFSMDLTAQCNNNDIKIQWNEQHSNNLNFIILQHSVDGVKFNPIYQYKPSNLGLSKNTFVHKGKSNEVNYYRLALMDIDDNATFSPIISKMPCEEILFSLSPNPFISSFEISSNKISNYRAIVSDLNGRKIVEKSTTSGIVKMDLKGLPNTIYSVEVHYGQSKQVFKVQKK